MTTIKSLRSYGCSFIFGTDLHDDGRDQKYPTPSQFTWPALLAKSADLNYICKARGGSGNLQILDRLLRDIRFYPQDFYVINWSWIDRFDYTDGSFDQNDRWYTLGPITEGSHAKTYFKYFHSEVKDKFTSLTYISTALDALLGAGAPFIMTYMDDLILDTRWHKPHSVRYLQKKIEPYLDTFEGTNFLDFSKDRGFEISPTLHPLEPAHEAGAQVMLPVFQERLQLGVTKK